MPLPLKSNQIALPNNRSLAFKRLMQLKCRFRRNSLFRQDYMEFMNEVIINWAEKIPDSELSIDNGNVNYVPHTGDYHPKKPGKIRVVFDCSAEFEGVSINDYLLRSQFNEWFGGGPLSFSFRRSGTCRGHQGYVSPVLSVQR